MKRHRWNLLTLALAGPALAGVAGSAVQAGTVTVTYDINTLAVGHSTVDVLGETPFQSGGSSWSGRSAGPAAGLLRSDGIGRGTDRPRCPRRSRARRFRGTGRQPPQARCQ